MNDNGYWEFVKYSRTPENREKTIAYLCTQLEKFLRRGERVLICFPCREPGSLIDLFEQAVQRCGAAQAAGCVGQQL